MEQVRAKCLGVCEGALIRALDDSLRNLRFRDLSHESTCRLATKLPNLIGLARVTGQREVYKLKLYYNIAVEEPVPKLA